MVKKSFNDYKKVFIDFSYNRFSMITNKLSLILVIIDFQ